MVSENSGILRYRFDKVSFYEQKYFVYLEDSNQEVQQMWVLVVNFFKLNCFAYLLL